MVVVPFATKNNDPFPKSFISSSVGIKKSWLQVVLPSATTTNEMTHHVFTSTLRYVILSNDYRLSYQPP